MDSTDTPTTPPSHLVRKKINYDPNSDHVTGCRTSSQSTSALVPSPSPTLSPVRGRGCGAVVGSIEETTGVRQEASRRDSHTKTLGANMALFTVDALELMKQLHETNGNEILLFFSASYSNESLSVMYLKIPLYTVFFTENKLHTYDYFIVS